MDLKIILAYVHLLGLAIGFYSISTRANALKELKHTSGLAAVFKADNLWGLAAFLWLLTGIWRAFGGVEKGTDYYLNSTAFLFKMGLFLLIFVLEIQPMITFIQWRIKVKKKQTIDFSKARRFATTSHVQLGLLSIIVLFAVAMARGIWV